MNIKKKKLETGCYFCGRKPKKLPYGIKRGKFWCSNCDRDLASGVNKKRARREGKKAANDN